MILNISGRTDVVHYYSDWLFKRFEEGFVLSRNTLFPNSVRRYELTPEKIDCITLLEELCSDSPAYRGNHRPFRHLFPLYHHRLRMRCGAACSRYRHEYRNLAAAFGKSWSKTGGMALRPCTADGTLYEGASFENVRIYGCTARGTYRPLHFQFCGDVPQAGTQFSGAYSDDTGG